MPRPFTLVFALAVLVAASPLHAGVRASLTIDLDDGRVLNAHQATAPSRPASLAKLMTVYLLLAARRDEQVKPLTAFEVSAKAASQPPTRLGLRAGDTLTVREASQALMVRSANDVAMVIAENLAPSEAVFVSRMNATARALGLRDTHFANPSGLPAPGARTTARDMALLTIALFERFGDYRHLFALRAAKVKGRHLATHHALLGSYAGAIGLKTGFTCRAGYNSVTVARRGERTIANVVLGASTPGERDGTARRLLDAGLAKYDATQGPALAAFNPTSSVTLNATIIADSCMGTGREGAYRISNWSVELEPHPSAAAARRRARAVGRGISTARPLVVPLGIGLPMHRANVTGLARATAVKLCKRLRHESQYCVVRSPATMTALTRRLRSGR